MAALRQNCGLQGPWAMPAARAVSMEGPTDFVFLEARGTLEHDGWDNSERSKRRYNQHYFDDLNSPMQKSVKNGTPACYTLDQKDPAPKGSGWGPYPLSLRIVNWVKWQRAETTSTEALNSHRTSALADQASRMAPLGNVCL